MNHTIYIVIISLLLYSCSDKKEVFFKDFSVEITTLDGYNSIIGKGIGCDFTIHELDEENKEKSHTFFKVEGGDGIAVVGEKEYMPYETIDFNHRDSTTLQFTYVPKTEGTHQLTIITESNLTTRQSSIYLNITDLKVFVTDLAPYVSVSDTTNFKISFNDDTDLFCIIRHLNGQGTLLKSDKKISEMDVIALEKENHFSYIPDIKGINKFRFTMSGKYGNPVDLIIIIEAI